MKHILLLFGGLIVLQTCDNIPQKRKTHAYLYKSTDDILIESDFGKLVSYTKQKLQSDSHSYKVFLILARQYSTDKRIGTDYFTQTYNSLYNSFNPLVRFFSRECLIIEFEKIIEKNNDDDFIKNSFPKSTFYYTNSGKLKYVSVGNSLVEIEKFWNSKERQLDYIKLVNTLPSCADSYLNCCYHDYDEQLQIMKMYLTLHYVIIRTDGGIQNIFLDSLGFE